MQGVSNTKNYEVVASGGISERVNYLQDRRGVQIEDQCKKLRSIELKHQINYLKGLILAHLQSRGGARLC